MFLLKEKHKADLHAKVVCLHKGTYLDNVCLCLPNWVHETHTQKQTHYLCGQCKQFSYEKETDYSVCCQNRKDPASALDLKQKQKLS